MKTKTKKIKIISILILLIFAIISIGVLTMSLNTTSYAMAFNAPAKIIVYYNEEVGNQVYERDSAQYHEIYLSICSAYKQSTLKAFINGDLNKSVKVEHGDNTSINFDGIKVNFVYASPQSVKLKSNVYLNDGESYWYQNLIFTISDVDKFQYNQVAIIPPINDDNYINQYTYSLSYKAYSNLGKTYDTLVEYFK